MAMAVVTVDVVSIARSALTWISPNVLALATLGLTIRWRRQDQRRLRLDFEVVAEPVSMLKNTDWVLQQVEVVVHNRSDRDVPLAGAELALAGLPGHALGLPCALTGLPGAVPAGSVVRFAVPADAVNSFVQSLKAELGRFPPEAHIIVQTHRGRDHKRWYSNTFPASAAVPGRRGQ